MDIKELAYRNLSRNILAPYRKRAATDSALFLRWFLENIYRQDPQDADDACVDSKLDKGLDGILVNDSIETIYLLQSKIRQKSSAKLGDTDLKEFYGSVVQFKDPENIQIILDGNANQQLKATLERESVKSKVEAGYSIEPIFCTNVKLNADGEQFLRSCQDMTVYDSVKICDEYIDIDIESGVDDSFTFSAIDSEKLRYETSEGVQARIFLANALQLVHMKGIGDASLFSRNVRLSLGNTKVNKSLLSGIRNKKEHKNFPLYHNGITILCDEIEQEDESSLAIRGYTVVNGAQSLTSLLQAKASITDDLKILVKVVESGNQIGLSEDITRNSNNQNAIKARDLKSNNPIHERLKREIERIDLYSLDYEVKRGEIKKSRIALSNEDAGLVLLAMDLGEPWSCHQKYKVMDDSHSRIFGRSNVDGSKIVALYKALEAVGDTLDDFDDSAFGHYNLTRYFVAYCTSEVIKSSESGAALFNNFQKVVEIGALDRFLGLFGDIASTVVDDINAEVSEDAASSNFDYKRELKSQRWCRHMSGKICAAYKKDVKRKRATPIDDLVSALYLSEL